MIEDMKACPRHGSFTPNSSRDAVMPRTAEECHDCKSLVAARIGRARDEEIAGTCGRPQGVRKVHRGGRRQLGRGALGPVEVDDRDSLSVY